MGFKNSSESDIQEVPDKKKVLSTNKSGKSLEVLDSDSDGFETKKDEFDVSDSDEGGFARKVASAVKKPPPKKLGKQQDIFADVKAVKGQPSKNALKKLPAPKKIVSKKKTLSEDIDDEKPAKKKKVFSDSSDFDDPPPPPREKAGGRSRAPVSYQGLDESDSDF